MNHIIYHLMVTVYAEKEDSSNLIIAACEADDALDDENYAAAAVVLGIQMNIQMKMRETKLGKYRREEGG